jgi:hypothetical protein
MSTLPIKRRDAFTGFSAAAILAGLTVPVFAEPAAPDATILAACAEFYEAKEDEARLDSLPAYGFRHPKELAVEAGLTACSARIDRALVTATSAAALTIAGLRAKAELVESVLPQAARDYGLEGDSLEILLAVSLAQDVLRLAGGAA